MADDSNNRPLAIAAGALLTMCTVTAQVQRGLQLGFEPDKGEG